MAKIGILGGSFHPFHNGHLFLGQYCLEQKIVDEIWFIPTGCSYLKADQKMLTGQQRYELVQAGIEGIPNMQVLDLEIKRAGNTYTYETMEELNRLYPQNQFYFIIGADCLFTIETWNRSDRIFNACTILAAKREGKTDRKIKDKINQLRETYQARIMLLDFPEMDISSTVIRERLENEEDVSNLLPQGVLQRIREKGYFKKEIS